jgi:predicted nucleic acid-binding protein
MKIYLDTCSLQRPLDNKSELRILLESEAVLGLVAQCESGALDALHLASAEAGQADYLCTCDDRFLRRARTLGRLATRVVSPLELIGEIERW